MRRRERNDEFDVSEGPPKPQLPTWDGQSAQPEWYIEVWQDRGGWHSRLMRDGTEVSHESWCHSEIDAVDAMVRAHENLINKDLTHAFYIPPDPLREDRA